MSAKQNSVAGFKTSEQRQMNTQALKEAKEATLIKEDFW